MKAKADNRTRLAATLYGPAPPVGSASSILLTNFVHYVELFADRFGVDDS